MSAYRLNASAELTPTARAPSSRLRALVVVAATLSVHAAVLVSAFVLRAKEPARPETAIVRVLAGHVDPATGAFDATGMANARIRR